MSKEALKTLRRAKKLISNKKNWCTNSYALDKKGKSVSPRSSDAVQFCAIGALRHANGPGKTQASKALRRAAARELKDITGDEFFADHFAIIDINDEHGHKATISMFDRAIEIAKKR